MRGRREDVAILSERLHQALLEGQRRVPGPEGMGKCPECGAIFSPTKSGRIRKHFRDPYDRLLCPMSGKKAA